MRILSVNVGLPRELASPRGRAVLSAIVKEPVAGRVAVRRENLDGDRQADLRVHGGPDKAVYAYPVEHYAHWAAELGRDHLPHGFFGENLTVEGPAEDEVAIGDTFRAGTALLQVSQPRTPCVKLALRVGDPAFGRAFLRSGRVGYYLRVLEEGELGAGDAFARVAPGRGGMSVREVSALLEEDAAAAGLARAAALPELALGWREWLAARAAALSRRPPRVR